LVGAHHPAGPHAVSLAGAQAVVARHYLAYARHDPAIGEAATVQAARLLLDHGADPDAGYLWRRAWDAIPLLVELGFDVNARARADIPMEQQRETALHEVASTGEVPIARLLIGLGADPGVRDARFDATPLGWAEYFHRDAMADFLRQLTSN
jgi:hypothetical protein